MEHFQSVPPLHFLHRQRAGMQVIAFLDHLRNLGELLRNLFRDIDLELHVVVIFLPSPQLLHVLRIIGVVIDGGHRTQLVEALDEHSLRVEIREAQRTDDFCHSLLLGIVLYGLKQSTAHLDVIHEVDPAEAYTFSLPTLIGLMIDDSCYTTHHLSLLVSQEILSLAEVEGGIFLLVQHEHIVAEQVGRIILVTFVEVVV